MKSIFLSYRFILPLALLFLNTGSYGQNSGDYDIVIYGGTSAGISAAIFKV